MIGCGGLWSVLMKRSGIRELSDFYPIRPECQADVPTTRFKPRYGKTLSERRWQASFDEEGRLDITKVLRRIQRGGVHPSIKGVVMEFLLGCYDHNCTFDERNELKQRRRGQYDMWKAECQKIVPVLQGSQNHRISSHDNPNCSPHRKFNRLQC